jgi:RimK family alpha-L-glutamate ligase
MKLSAMLIISGFLSGGGYDYITKRFAQAAQQNGVCLDIKTNVEMCVFLAGKKDLLSYKKAIFWDKDILLAQFLENQGIKIFNSKASIENCDSKAKTALVLHKAGINQPKTLFVPKHYQPFNWLQSNEFIKQCENALGFPCVVKQSYGSFGSGVFLCQNKSELAQKLSEISPCEALVQEFCANSYGRDIRVYCIGGEVAAAIERFNPNDFRSNISNGGIANSVTLTKEQKQTALACTKALNLDFAGIDLLFGKAEEPVVCEVNSNAHFAALEAKTGADIAGKILRHMLAG